jgi:ribonuclease HI
MKPSRNWFQSVLCDLPDHLVDTTLLVDWRAWYARNEVTHDKPLPSLDGSKRFLLSYLKLIHNVKDTPTDTILKGKMPMVDSVPPPSPVLVKKGPDKPWSAPPPGWVKLTVDGSFQASDRTAGIGMVLRNAEGLPIFSSCRSLDDCEAPLEAELRACVEGLTLALVQSQLPIIVETDCSQLVAATKSLAQDRSPFLFWIAELLALVNQGRVCTFVKVERSQVRVSHILANLARVERRTATWLGSGPEVVLQVLDHDRIVTPPI